MTLPGLKYVFVYIVNSHSFIAVIDGIFPPFTSISTFAFVACSRLV